jgi:2-polyprenyl-3-methyl-5-hydroxy-6-metoxy-1,4-benzoquinol methylase
MSNFKDTKIKFKQAVQGILKDHSSYEIDEAALPAYAHKNPVIDYIFWRRVEVAYNYALDNKAKRVLDFGCGTGLLSYALAKEGVNVFAIDLHFGPLNLVKSKVDFPSNIEFAEADLMEYDLPEHSFDMIIALDVLEHIENLDDYIIRFKYLLKPGGKIIVSGPTENFLYKIGRKLAGEKFTGDYHISNINAIKKQFEKQMKVRTLRRLIWPLTLFEIFVAENY